MEFDDPIMLRKICLLKYCDQAIMACVENMFMQNLQKLIKIPPAKPAVSIETETLIPNLGFFAFHIAKKNPGSQVQQKSFIDYCPANSPQYQGVIYYSLPILNHNIQQY